MTTPSSGHGAVPIGPDDEQRGARPAWLIPLLATLAVLLLALLLWLLLRDGGDDDELESAASPSPSAPGTELPSETPEASDITTTQPSAQGSSSAAATATAAPSTAPSAPAQGDVALTAGTEEVFPLQSPDQDLSGFMGEVVGRSVPVESVPADEGFWLGTGEDQRVWVEIVAIEGETPFTVRPGEKVSFTGAEFVPHDETYAARLEITADEGADQLTAQMAHIQVRSADLRAN